MMWSLAYSSAVFDQDYYDYIGSSFIIKPHQFTTH